MKISKQTVQQLILLGIIVVIIIAYLVYRTISGNHATSQTTTSNDPITTTTFDQSALQGLQTRGTDYPDVAPAASDQGKSNPFGK